MTNHIVRVHYAIYCILNVALHHTYMYNRHANTKPSKETQTSIVGGNGGNTEVVPPFTTTIIITIRAS